MDTKMDLPMGKWLARERQRLDLTVAAIAKGSRLSAQSIAAVERNNRVIPPGWCESLRTLGIVLAEPIWPSNMRPYLGADLKHEMETRSGLKHSEYWLSKELAINEEQLKAILRENTPVPLTWLLKLAELGANVPTQVKVALCLGGEGLDTSEVSAIFDAQRLWHEVRALRLERAEFVERLAEIEKGPSQRPESIHFHWTKDDGVHFSMSAALLDRVPGGAAELVAFLRELGVLKAPSGA